LEFAINGSLRDFLERHGDRVSPSDRLRWSIQTAIAISFLHSVDILHGDLKTANILLDEQLNAKLSDYSCATITTGNLAATAPLPMEEVYETTHKLPGKAISIETEVFAFGSTLYEIMTGCQPYHELFSPNLNHRDGIIKLFKENKFPSTQGLGDAGHIISKCWTVGYGSFDEIKEDLILAQSK
jgi:serine/threonine protein kinase